LCLVEQEDESISASFDANSHVSHDLLAFCPYPYPLPFLVGTRNCHLMTHSNTTTASQMDFS